VGRGDAVVGLGAGAELQGSAEHMTQPLRVLESRVYLVCLHVSLNYVHPKKGCRLTIPGLTNGSLQRKVASVKLI
jgi:hypothetical protein